MSEKAKLDRVRRTNNAHYRALFLTDPPVVRAILMHLELPHRPPPLAPARGPPQTDLLTDPASEFDPVDPDPVPDLVFDQSIPDEFDV